MKWLPKGNRRQSWTQARAVQVKFRYILKLTVSFLGGRRMGCSIASHLDSSFPSLSRVNARGICQNRIERPSRPSLGVERGLTEILLHYWRGGMLD